MYFEMYLKYKWLCTSAIPFFRLRCVTFQIKDMRYCLNSGHLGIKIYINNLPMLNQQVALTLC